MPERLAPLPQTSLLRPAQGACAMSGCRNRAADAVEVRLGGQLRPVPMCSGHAVKYDVLARA